MIRPGATGKDKVNNEVHHGGTKEKDIKIEKRHAPISPQGANTHADHL